MYVCAGILFGPRLIVRLYDIHNFVKDCEARSNVIDSDFICKGLGNHTKRDYVSAIVVE